ncbi:MAG: tetratricopeptide repeat protein [Rhodobacter sp.]|nr:tetratricopeptide repeat protein [Rhodobacter sp.]MCY4169529.1 tetratricopeptide repeat protein [Rhodobacter sp.]MCY4242065.1 tetratricopeptide repeat protein [Rhodobacter sp.]
MACVLVLGLARPAVAEMAEVELMLDRLADPGTKDWEKLERQIVREWSKSGSAAMDMLLKRGREAIRDGRHDIALEHLTALTDHAPDFAEGWYTRASALFHMEMYGPAISDIGRALSLNSRHFGAMMGMATILQHLDMVDEALEVLEMVRAVHPHYPGLEHGMEALESLLDGQRL